MHALLPYHILIIHYGKQDKKFLNIYFYSYVWLCVCVWIFVCVYVLHM